MTKYYRKKIGDMTIYYYQHNNHWLGRLVPPAEVSPTQKLTPQQVHAQFLQDTIMEKSALSPCSNLQEDCPADHAHFTQVVWEEGNMLNNFHLQAEREWRKRANDMKRTKKYF